MRGRTANTDTAQDNQSVRDKAAALQAKLFPASTATVLKTAEKSMPPTKKPTPVEDVIQSEVEVEARPKVGEDDVLEVYENREFKRNREAIQYFFETEQLRGLIKEFFHVQKQFHDKMNNMVSSFSTIYPKLSEEDQHTLDALLKPYGVMVANPFADKPSGDLFADLLHISTVINHRNEHFFKLLQALFNASANLEGFHDFLSEIRKDPVIKARLMGEANHASWMYVQGDVDAPFQNMVRYELLLKSMAKELEKAGCPPTEELMKNLMGVISYYNPRLEYINKNKDFLIELMKVEYFITQIAEMPCFKLAEKSISGIDVQFEDIFEAIRAYIAGAKSSLAKGVFKASDTLSGLLTMLDHLREDIAPIVENMRKEQYEQERYVETGYRHLVSITSTLFGPNIIFNEPNKDPLDKLDEISAALKDQVVKARQNEVAFDFFSQMADHLEKEEVQDRASNLRTSLTNI